MFFFGCIFLPEEPPLPAGKFEDRLNLRNIVSGTSAYFSFNNYRELFEDCDTLYCDVNDQKYKLNDFLGRISFISADTSIECFWEAVNAGTEYVSMSGAVELNVREYKIISKNFPDTITGEVRITIKYVGLSGWQIVHWREVGEKYSYFHPRFGNPVFN